MIGAFDSYQTLTLARVFQHSMKFFNALLSLTLSNILVSASEADNTLQIKESDFLDLVGKDASFSQTSSESDSESVVLHLTEPSQDIASSSGKQEESLAASNNSIEGSLGQPAPIFKEETSSLLVELSPQKDVPSLADSGTETASLHDENWVAYTHKSVMQSVRDHEEAPSQDKELRSKHEYKNRLDLVTSTLKIVLPPTSDKSNLLGPLYSS